MIPCVPTCVLLAEQKELAERVPTLWTPGDLAAFLRDVNAWLHTPGVSNCVSVHSLDGAWRLRLNDAPFSLTDSDKEALVEEINSLRLLTV